MATHTTTTTTPTAAKPDPWNEYMTRLHLILALTIFVSVSAAAAETPAVTAAASESSAKAALFINLTTADPHRASMAIGFALNQLKRSHKVTIFANDQGVKVLPIQGDVALTEQRASLAAFIAAGGTVLACPTCTKHFALDPAGYLPGVVVSNPEMTEKALFAADTRTLSW
jgi:hypothetical protein